MCYPAPNGYRDVEVEPEDAYFHEQLREFVLPYSIIETCVDPEETLLQFLNCTYQKGVTLGRWDRYLLET